MSKALEELKGLSPAYADIPNGEFAYRVWNSEKEKAESLEETTPMGLWADEYNLSNEDFKSMLEFSKTAGYDPVERTISSEHIPEGAEGRALFQGQTFGFGDEIIGGLAATVEVATGNEKPFTELYTQYRDSERQKMKEYRESAPKEALAYEVGGAFLSPAMALRAPKAIEGLTAGKKAATISGTYGAAYGAGSSEEETFSGIAKDTAITGVSSSLFGLGLQKAIPFVGKKAQDVSKWLKKAEDTPTIETLKIAKNKAYGLVKSSKVVFDSKDLGSLLTEARKLAVQTHHQPVAEPQVKAALNIFKGIKNQGTPQTLAQLDKIRQKLSKYYASHPDQPALGGMVDIIDKAIQKKATQNPIMEAARLANTRYKKAEKIEHALHLKMIAKADKPYMSEAAMYKDAIKSLLRSKKDIRWFSSEEQKMLEKFIEGDVVERAIERTAGFAPSANKLMTMLAFAGSYFQPLFLVPTGLGMVAKRISDKSIQNKADILIKTMGGRPPPTPKVLPGMPQVGIASAISQEQ